MELSGPVRVGLAQESFLIISAGMRYNSSFEVRLKSATYRLVLPAVVTGAVRNSGGIESLLAYKGEPGQYREHCELESRRKYGGLLYCRGVNMEGSPGIWRSNPSSDPRFDRVGPQLQLHSVLCGLRYHHSSLAASKLAS